MRLKYEVDQQIILTFLPLKFSDMAILFDSMFIEQIETLNIGLFDDINGDQYIDTLNYKNYLGEIRYVSDILTYLNKYPEENYSIYKLELFFNNFKVFYDDDSFIKITSKDLTQYDFFHELYLKIIKFYRQSELD
ncbi:MAG TPA: hypothetical protein VEA37_12135 [Flavobacterium sp.]|nr:hypothetical protein [Flavobacterium sp.]